MLLAIALMFASNDELALQLSGWDNKITPALLAEISADPAADLITIANDEAQPMHVRRRAVGLLSRFIETRSERALKRLAEHEDASLRARAASGLRFMARKYRR